MFYNLKASGLLAAAAIMALTLQPACFGQASSINGEIHPAQPYRTPE